MKRLQSNYPAQRTSQRPSSLPELPTFSSKTDNQVEEGQCAISSIKLRTSELMEDKAGAECDILYEESWLNNNPGGKYPVFLYQSDKADLQIPLSIFISFANYVL
ncbi:hypothetical protein T265_10977 [Opisthorchis viverrini]|uniref:Uncharacterized protein n=1 Tax=Opisthorchis viverrini TaxID=6198 RepID=A0A074Z4N9_OPIVI|nr:hypothetical protein T265_10977 [Opisthorchis viverrini]KER20492.1 hypothetical protein T265_10977 [Opisthorchis viverrini]